MNEPRTVRRGSFFTLLVLLISTLILTALIVVFFFFEASPVAAQAYQYTAHSNKDTGAQYVFTPAFSDDATDTGRCRNCHMEHASWNSGAGTINAGVGYKNLNMLDNTLLAAGVCYQCHTNALPNGAWPGRTPYNASRHGSSVNVVWPGANPAAQTAGEVNLCINCHNPHGRLISAADNLTHAGSGWSPATIAWKDMLVRQEENLCLTCHDGAPAADNISATLALAANDGTNYYNHPISRNAAANDRTPYYHTGDETGAALTSANRHVECEDCHNPHMALAGTSALEDSRAGGVLTGAWGVRPGAWPAIPATTKDGDGANYTNDMPAAPTFTAETVTTGSPEYFLCLRCHSSYSQSATGAWPSGASPSLSTDVSREINPNNLAHHAIAAVGKLQSTRVPYGNFVNGWDTQSLVTCSNCHSYKTSANPRGPHGSANKWILNDYDTTAVGLPDNGNKVFCFNCHNYAVYYDGASIAGVAQARINHPVNGLAQHQDATVTITGIQCMNCHGGRTNGGMHGTSWGGFAATGATNPGEHFMNGAVIRGFTYNTGANKVACWTDNAAQQAANPYNLGCTRGHGGTTEPVNWDY